MSEPTSVPIEEDYIEKDEETGIGHGLIKRYQTGFTYIPVDIWKKLELDGKAEYVEDMQTMLIFKPGMDEELLMLSIDLIKKYLEKEIQKKRRRRK